MGGRIKYVPKIVIDHIEEIKRSDGLDGYDCVAFRRMVEYSRKYREIKQKDVIAQESYLGSIANIKKHHKRSVF